MKNITKTAILPLFLCAPVQYYCKFLKYDSVALDNAENYTKQTYRNRYKIQSANGILVLSIPIVKGRTPGIKYADAEISYDTDWQKLHIRSLESAYRHSPFFEFYWDDLLPFFTEKTESLWEFNLKMHRTVLQMLSIRWQERFCDEFVPESDEKRIVLRDLLHSKAGKSLPDPNFHAYPYYQVFSDRHAFMPNLSILDLIFNEGPNAISILRESIRR